ncbi:MAG TPA: efflux RND transporter periplasmic adaptor subunit, partial [Gammaproteobacteria bacterium]|nr:efflux RND transporter periplasmic adaptor subunit [Gammaproteobacteria bacterium]
MRNALIFCLALFAGPSLADEAPHEATAPPATLPFKVGVATVTRVDYERLLNGTVDAVNETTISAETSGTVTAIYYDVDDFVKQGDIILRIKATT